LCSFDVHIHVGASVRPATGISAYDAVLHDVVVVMPPSPETAQGSAALQDQTDYHFASTRRPASVIHTRMIFLVCPAMTNCSVRPVASPSRMRSTSISVVRPWVAIKIVSVAPSGQDGSSSSARRRVGCRARRRSRGVGIREARWAMPLYKTRAHAPASSFLDSPPARKHSNGLLRGGNAAGSMRRQLLANAAIAASHPKKQPALTLTRGMAAVQLCDASRGKR
jgi:hypothetical protein